MSERQFGTLLELRAAGLQPTTCATPALHKVSLMPQLIPFSAVVERTGLAPGVVIKLTATRRFPRPIPEASRPMWWSDEVQQWLDERDAK